MACNPKVYQDCIMETTAPSRDREKCSILIQDVIQVREPDNAIQFIACRAGEATSVWSLTVSF